MISLARIGLVVLQATLLAACSSFTHEYVDGGSSATFGGRQYLGIGQAVFKPIDTGKLVSAGTIEATNEPSLDPTALALPGVAPEMAFLAKRGDGSLVVFVLRDTIANGRLVGQGVPALCPLMQQPAPGECPGQPSPSAGSVS